MTEFWTKIRKKKTISSSFICLSLEKTTEKKGYLGLSILTGWTKKGKKTIHTHTHTHKLSPSRARRRITSPLILTPRGCPWLSFPPSPHVHDSLTSLILIITQTACEAAGHASLYDATPRGRNDIVLGRSMLVWWWVQRLKPCVMRLNKVRVFRCSRRKNNKYLKKGHMISGVSGLGEEEQRRVKQ